MRTITLEEHFAPPGFLDGAGRQLRDNIAKTGARGAKILEQLVEIDDKRIADMDAAGIDMQVLSINAPGTEQLEAADALTIARDSNEFLAAAVKKHPKRFAGLRRIADHGAGQGRRRAGALRARARLSRRADQRPRPRPLHGRQILLADLRARRGAQRADLHAPDAAAAGGGRGAIFRLLAGSKLGVRDLGLGLAHRDRHSRSSIDPRRRVRPLSKTADRGRSPERRPILHAAAARPQFSSRR